MDTFESFVNTPVTEIPIEAVALQYTDRRSGEKKMWTAAMVNSLFRAVTINVDGESEPTVVNFHKWLQEEYTNSEGKTFAGTLSDEDDLHRMYTYWMGQRTESRDARSHERAISRLETLKAQAEANSIERAQTELITRVASAAKLCDTEFDTDFVTQIRATPIERRSSQGFWLEIQTAVRAEVAMAVAFDPEKELPAALQAFVVPASNTELDISVTEIDVSELTS